MRYALVFLFAMSFLLQCCNGGPEPKDPDGRHNLPDETLSRTFPSFTMKPNEAEGASSLVDIDPTLVLGSLFNIKTGEVMMLVSCLAAGAKPELSVLEEQRYKKLIDNELTASVSWLSFLSGSVSTKEKAEVTVTKTLKAEISREDIDRAAVNRITVEIPRLQRARLGIVVGYVNFLLSSTIFREDSADVKSSGYGVQIDGHWHSKAQEGLNENRVVIIYTPLPFIEAICDTDSDQEIHVTIPEAYNDPVFVKDLYEDMDEEYVKQFTAPGPKIEASVSQATLQDLKEQLE